MQQRLTNILNFAESYKFYCGVLCAVTLFCISDAFTRYTFDTWNVSVWDFFVVKSTLFLIFSIDVFALKFRKLKIFLGSLQDKPNPVIIFSFCGAGLALTFGKAMTIGIPSINYCLLLLTPIAIIPIEKTIFKKKNSQNLPQSILLGELILKSSLLVGLQFGFDPLKLSQNQIISAIMSFIACILLSGQISSTKEVDRRLPAVSLKDNLNRTRYLIAGLSLTLFIFSLVVKILVYTTDKSNNTTIFFEYGFISFLYVSIASVINYTGEVLLVLSIGGVGPVVAAVSMYLSLSIGWTIGLLFFGDGFSLPVLIVMVLLTASVLLYATVTTSKQSAN